MNAHRPSFPSLVPSASDAIEIAKHVLEHAAIRVAVVELEIADAEKRTSRISETLLMQRERRTKELVAACVKFSAAQTAKAKAAATR